MARNELYNSLFPEVKFVGHYRDYRTIMRDAPREEWNVATCINKNGVDRVYTYDTYRKRWIIVY